MHNVSTVVVYSGDGGDLVHFDAHITGNLHIETGAGPDRIFIEGIVSNGHPDHAVVGGNLVIDGGNGGPDWIRVGVLEVLGDMSLTTHGNSDAWFYTGRPGNVLIAGDLTCATDSGDDSIELHDLECDGTAIFDLGIGENGVTIGRTAIEKARAMLGLSVRSVNDQKANCPPATMPLFEVSLSSHCWASQQCDPCADPSITSHLG